MFKNVRIGLALGGGGARGCAHIGVIKVLEKYNIFPDYICGTSMGSVVGSLYASGMSVNEMEQYAKKTKVLNLIDFNISAIKNGLFIGNKMQKYIERFCKNLNIEDLKIPFSCVSTDLKTSKQYVFKSGKLSLAVRASSCVPGVFKPIKKDDMLLVDGGVINNVPCDIVKESGVDYVIGVDCIGKPDFKDKDFNSVFEILLTSFDIAQTELAHLKAKKNANFMLSFSTGIGASNYSKKWTEKAILVGELETEKVINKLLKSLEKVNQKKSNSSK